MLLVVAVEDLIEVMFALLDRGASGVWTRGFGVMVGDVPGVLLLNANVVCSVEVSTVTSVGVGVL